MSLGTTRPRVDEHGVASSANRFRERALSHRRRPWRRALLVALAAAVVAGLVWMVGWSTGWAWTGSRSPGVTGAEAQAVARLVEVPVGTPLARVDTEAVGARVRERVTVAEVSVRRSWPGTLTVEVVPRSAALVVRNPQGRLEVVDAEGVSFGTVRSAPKGVPVVTATGDEGTTRRPCGRHWRCSRRCPPTVALGVRHPAEQRQPGHVHAGLSHRGVGRRRGLGPQGRDPDRAAAHQGEGHRRQRTGHAGHPLSPVGTTDASV